MTYSAPTPDELRKAARSACEGQPESELHKHPAWRAADLIEQEADRFLTGTGTAQTPTGLMEAAPQEQLRREPTAPTIGEQWWLAKLDQHGNPTLTDGAHSDRAGADQAKYLLDRLGLSRDRRLVVARVTLSEANPSGEGVNEEAVGTLNSIGLRPKP
jgi:hypothetical protein